MTTIPAAASVAVAGALGERGEASGAVAQLDINLASIVLAGVVTLYLQRRIYVSRRLRHLREPAREKAGLPVGRSSRSVLAGPPKSEEEGVD